MTYPIKFREHVLSLRLKERLTLEETSKRFKIGRASLTRWLNRIEPSPAKTRYRKIDMEALKQDVLRYPEAYLQERAKRFNVAVSSLHIALKRLGVSYKKNSKTPQSKRRRTAYFPKKD